MDTAETEITSLNAGASVKRSFLRGLVVRLVREKPLGTFGAVIVTICFLAGVFANVLAPYDPNEMHKGFFLSPPSTQFLLGTDNLGRDMFSRIIFGARVSMVVGICGTLLATLVSVVIGVLSGFFGGKFDIVMQRIVDAIMCFPWIFLVLGIMAIVGQGMAQVIIVLGTLYGVRNSRIVRSAVLAIRENAYVEAAKAIGSSSMHMMLRHIIPNVMGPVIVIASIGIAYMIVSEATISFLGFGIPPPTPSWGGMITTGGRRYMIAAPWIAVWPGVALSLVVFGANVLGDAVRDIIDPRLRGGVGSYSMASATRNRKRKPK